MIKKSTDKPEDHTSCDHLISHEPGLIEQVIGRLTYLRYLGTIICTDHILVYMYTHLIKGTTTEETVLAKSVHERLAREHSVRVRGYCADNLVFDDA